MLEMGQKGYEIVSKYKNKEELQAIKKRYDKTAPYVHLTFNERRELIKSILQKVAGWDECRLFAQAVPKAEFFKKYPQLDLFENSFADIVSRFEHFLENRGRSLKTSFHGLLVQDNNPTVAKKLTAVMRKFHRQGTVCT